MEASTSDLSYREKMMVRYQGYNTSTKDHDVRRTSWGHLGFKCMMYFLRHWEQKGLTCELRQSTVKCSCHHYKSA